MTDIRKHPQCEKACPDRNGDCHATCERYAAWRQKMDEEARERRRQIEARQGVADLAKERKIWLKSRGYKVKI